MNPPPKALQCPRCGFSVGIDPTDHRLNLAYDREAWRKTCIDAHASGLATCPHMIDLIRELTRNRSGNGGLQD